jgi:hypothetical protein
MKRWSAHWRRTIWKIRAGCVGVMDARARGLVVQAVLPAKALVGA